MEIEIGGNSLSDFLKMVGKVSGGNGHGLVDLIQNQGFGEKGKLTKIHTELSLLEDPQRLS